MKQKMKKAAVLLTALCVLVTGLLSGTGLFGSRNALAGEVTDGSAGELVPRATFTNAENDAPDLYVTKHVVSAAEGYDIPDISFAFVLKLGGKLAGNTEYRLYSKAGEELFHMSGSNKIPWKTDRNGTFSLKAGQTAKFEYVGSGISYEVRELSLSEGFTQLAPGGGLPAVGTIPPKGTRVEFTNQYLPTGEEEKTTSLVVRKSVSFPEGFAAPETPDFTFQLTLDGKKYSGETYTIRDTDTGDILGTGVTGTGTEEGCFTLKGGQSAVFAQIPTGVDYRVEELETPASAGWRVTGSSVQEGATISPETQAAFHNASASFAVTKRLEDNSQPDVGFTFLLTKADRSVWAGAQYLLYGPEGKPVESAGGGTQPGESAGDGAQTGADAGNGAYVTDAAGQFVLKPGQTAVFLGIEPGTVYNVSEKGRPDYIQVLPNSPEGYTDKAVSDAVEVLPFINRPAPKTRLLTVTKLVENTEGQAAFAKDTFTFVLTKKTGEGFAPAAGAVYSIQAGTAVETYRTDEKGQFSIHAEETARFEGLPAGEYAAEEMNLSPEYEEKKTDQDGAPYVHQGILGEEPLGFTFVNSYKQKAVDLYLCKKDRKSEAPLSGAEFMLYRDEAFLNPVSPAPYVTDNEGRIVIGDLPAGFYYLKETKAPKGYQLLTGPITLEIRREGKEIQVKVDGKEYAPEEQGDTAGQIYVEADKAAGKENVHITIYNSKNFLLPRTGGAGSPLALLAAAGLALLSLWFVRKVFRKEEA